MFEKNPKLRNRILSSILVLATLISLLPLGTFSIGQEQATEPPAASVSPENSFALSIALDGTPISSLLLEPHKKQELQADGAPEEASYQWQILHPKKDDLWINIYDATDRFLHLSAALICNMLDAEGAARLRCRAWTETGEAYSDALTVVLGGKEPAVTVISGEPAETLPAEAEAPETEITDAPATTIPEETTVPEETTIPEETTVPEETTIPEETTVPEETTIPEETTVPEETTIPEETTVPEETTIPEETTVPEETTAPEEINIRLAAAPRSIGQSGAMLLAEGDDDSDFVTVTIEYIRYDILWENGKMVVDTEGNPVLNTEGDQAFTSYIATLQKGTDLKTSVNNPTMIGYDTYLEDATESSLKVDIDLTNITENVTYTVKYKPALVDYAVRYFFQNIYDDQYVEDTSLQVQSKGYTGATPPNSQMNMEVDGFTPLYYQPDSIAADSSTVFEVFYERNYYLMEFDCNGGYGAETLYNRYESYVSVPTPVRPGYVFLGWDLVESEEPGFVHDDAVDGHLDNMPPYHTAYKALWTTSATSYTVVYWRENANDNGYSYWDSVVIGVNGNGTLNGTVNSNDHVSGTDHVTATGLSEAAYFTYNAEKTMYEESQRTDLAADGKVIVEGDGSTVVNVYYSRNVYTLTLTDGSVSSCQIKEHTHTDDCYGYDCGGVVHTKDCYVCKKDTHTHTDACCSLYHIHEESCAGACEHPHGIGCYTNTTVQAATTDHTGFNKVDATFPSPTEGVIYRYRENRNSTNSQYYHNYIYVNNTWYYLGTGNGNSVAGLDWSGNNPNKNSVNASDSVNDPEVCDHLHGDQCYNCGKTPHTHAADETCNLEDCPNGGNEHSHNADCYLCAKEEIAHTTACCSITPHTHSSCSPSKCFHSHEITCYSNSTSIVQATNQTGFTNVKNTAGSTPSEATIYRYRQYSNTYHNYVYIGGTWYYLGSSTNNNTVAGFTWDGNNPTSNGTTKMSNVTNSPTLCSHAHEDKCYSCGLNAHTHGDGKCDAINCVDDTHHAHTGACYTCGNMHVHTSACPKVLICDEVEHSHLTGDTFGRSIVKIIQKKYGAYIGDEWTFTTKDGHIYPENAGAASWRPVNAGSLTQRLALIDIMPGLSFELYDDPQTNNTSKYYNYYVECLPGETADVEYEGVKYKHYLKNGTLTVDFNIYTEAEDFFPIEGFTKYRAVRNGTTISNNASLSSGQTVNFYYKRKIVNLKFYNINKTINTVSNLMYEYPLKDVTVSSTTASAYEPPYPTTYEPGAYAFSGWYTTPDCFPGTEVDWTTDTMPATDLEIYAKWTPILRNVTFYSAYSDIALDEADKTDKVYYFMKAEGVPHGQTVGSTYFDIPEHPKDLDRAINNEPEAEMYDFIGWFYMDEDNKKRFAPDSMEVTSDLVLFAEWNTSVDTEYEVKYVLRDAVSKENTVTEQQDYPAGAEIAVTESGHASVGKTKTFTAKGLGDLYEDFQKRFFPTVNSHSILMEAKNPEDSQNRFTFEYVYDDKVFYKVRYLDYATKEPIHDPVIASTDDAVITVKFKPKEGYIPQNFYIRKALAYDGSANADSVIEENVITFYYVKDTEHGLYSIEYYKENVDSTDSSNADNYTQYESIVGSADLKDAGGKATVITAALRTYQGFTHVPALNTVVTYKDTGDVDKTTTGVGKDNSPPAPYGTISYTGLTIKVYYSRNAYPYTVEYRESGSNKLLHTAETGSAKFDSLIIRTGPSEFMYNNGTDTPSDDITYEYYIPNASEEVRTKEITIREDSGSAKNIITFFYTQKKVEVQYIPVCLDENVPDDVKSDMKKIGAVSLNAESAISASNLAGSTATAADGFRFVGWYKDKACTVPVDASWVIGDTHLKPLALYQNDEWVNVYYALFAPVKENLKIIKQVTEGSSDSFLFRVTGTDVLKNDVDLLVSIQGNGSITIKDLYCGTYTVTELVDWSWTYSCTDGAVKTVILTTKDTDSGGKPLDPQITTYEVTFTNSANPVDWFHGESAPRKNQFAIAQLA